METRHSCGKCEDGWICEVHPDRPWPHEACAGPRTPCVCSLGSDKQPAKTSTGLVCPKCRRPVGQIEEQSLETLMFSCRECWHRWRWDESVASK